MSAEIDLHDPLLALINEYRAGLSSFDAHAPEARPLDFEGANALRDETFGPAYERLATAPPAALTLAGAVEAIRLVIQEAEYGPEYEFTHGVLSAALAYFDGCARH